jgi:hypothetical protein
MIQTRTDLAAALAMAGRRLRGAARSRWTGLATLLVVGSIAIGTGQHGAQAVVDAIRDPASVLAGRSPGSRPPGALYQTKRPRVSRRTSRASPTARAGVPPALARNVPPEVVPSFDAGPAELSFGPAPLTPGDLGFVPGAPAGGLLPTPGGETGLPVPVGISTPGIPGVPVVPVAPPASPVPETSTWATMVTGFLAVGAMLRRRARPARSVVAA